MEADDQQQPKPCRFQVANDEEISNILLAKDSINTKRSTKAAAKCFRDFLTETGLHSGRSGTQNCSKHVARIDVTSGCPTKDHINTGRDTTDPVYVNYYLSNGDHLWRPRGLKNVSTAEEEIFHKFTLKRYLPGRERNDTQYSESLHIEKQNFQPIVISTDIPESYAALAVPNMAVKGLSFGRINPAFHDDNEKQAHIYSKLSKYVNNDVKIDVGDPLGASTSKNDDNDDNFDDDTEQNENIVPKGKTPPTAQILPIIPSSKSCGENDSMTIDIIDGQGQGQAVNDVIVSVSSSPEEVASNRNGNLPKENEDIPNDIRKKRQLRRAEDADWLWWIEQQFTAIAGQDGEISLEEFKDALKVRKSFFAERFFALFDQDHSGSIELHELLDGLRTLTKGTSAQKLKFLFDVYDVDGSGTIDRQELKTVLMSCTEESSLSISEEDMDALTDLLFDSADEDHSGAISFEEMKAELEKHPGVLENLSISAAQWLKPPAKKTPKRATRYFTYAYIRNNLKKLVFFIVYILVNLSLAVYSLYSFWNSNGFYIVARVCGMNLNFNCMFILVLMLRKSMTYLLMTKLSRILPLEQNIFFHKMVGWVIAFAAIFHSLAHVGNAILVTHGGDLALWEFLFTTRAGLGWVGNSAMLVGWALDIVLTIMIICSLEFVRRGGHFQVFYTTHMLYLLFWFLLILHGPNFWKWFIGPGVIFVMEKLSRSKLIKKARYGDTFVQEVNILPSSVTHLVISRPDNFQYKAGDYVFIQIPVIAKHEWHPFTISSAPEMTGQIWLHVRSAGHWTNKCYRYFENLDPELEKGKTVVRVPLQKRKSRHLGIEGNIKITRLGNIEAELEEESRLRRKEKTKAVRVQCYIDGPYGTATRDIYETEHAVLVGTGIGITPMASILQSVMYRYKASKRTCPHCHNSFYGEIPESTMKLRKVDFVWVNRDQKAFEWFLTLLTQLEVDQAEVETCGGDAVSNRIIDMHMFMTAAQKKTDMKGIGLQMALDLMHQKEKKDLITGLRTKTQPGRPNWGNLFENIVKENRGKVKVFFCGAPALGKTIKAECEKLKIGFSKENF